MYLIRNYNEYLQVTELLTKLVETVEEEDSVVEEELSKCENPYIIYTIIKRIGIELECNRSKVEREIGVLDSEDAIYRHLVAFAEFKHSQQLPKEVQIVSTEDDKPEFIDVLIVILESFYLIEEYKDDNGDFICQCTLDKEMLEEILDNDSQSCDDYEQFN